MNWIPCKERLPEAWGERYLITINTGAVMVGGFTGTKWTCQAFHLTFDEVMAWAELPTPYAEGE